jgi:cytochrome c oxidase subunit 2
MIEYLIPSASTYAGGIDFTIWLVAVLVGFWTVVTAGMFFWLMWRYRARDGVKAEYVTGDEKHLKRWVTWPHLLILVCDIAIIVVAVNVWIEVKQTLPVRADGEPDAEIHVIGQQWAWTFVHPGPDGELDTEDDIRMVDELHIEVDTLYHFHLAATDVLHSFSVPVFRLKQDAVPGRVISGWFEATRTGVYDIQCAEMCGIGHGIMGARIHIETPEQHAAWVSEHAPPAVLAANTARGRLVAE